MTILDTQYDMGGRTVLGDLDGLVSGSLPDWLEGAHSGGGSHSVDGSTGEVTISSGESATGDFGRIRTVNDIVPEVDGHDALYVRATFATSTGSVEASAMRLGLYESGSTDLYHQWYSPSSADRFSITRRVGGTGYETPTREVVPSVYPATTELLWDITDGKLIHRYGGTYALTISSNLPNITNPYNLRIISETQDTSQDHTISLRDFEVARVDQINR